ncbi:hypothetical protein R1sor_001636 [Riccia sorocarpa]|uniref:Uncharacterized protein n=1 Tax=Riccia sorocarpa TaxID=122646 RepID=A0ABD3H2E4_9MARC
MSKRDYELIVEYLEDSDHFQQIMGNGKKTKVGGKNLTKKTAFGHMAVHLAALCFPPCNGTVMGKKFDRFYDSYKHARIFYTGTGAGITEEESRSGITLEQKMNAKCPYFFRMHALFGSRATVDPPAVGDFGLADEGVYIPDPVIDSQLQEPRDVHLSGSVEECGGVDLSNDLDNEEAEMDDMPSNGRGKRKFVQENGSASCAFRRGGVEKPKIPERKQNLIGVYEDSVQARNSYRQAALHARDDYRHVVLAEKRMAREESEKRAKVDRRAQLLAELSKAGKSIEDIRAVFELLDSVEMTVSIA